MRGWLLPTLVGFTIAGLIGASVIAGALAAQLGEANDEVAALGAEVDDLERQLDAEPDPATPTPGPAPSEPSDGDDERALGQLDEVSAQQCIVGDEAPDLGDLLGDDEAPAEPDALVDDIADDVEQLRDLEFDAAVDVEFLTRRQAGARIAELIAEEYPADQAEADSRLLAALGVVEPGTDMLALQQELLSEQVAGFYVPETEELVVVRPESDVIPPASRVTIAHELLHALTDQQLGLPDTGEADGDEPELDEDAALASLAVTEGDASLTEGRWTVRNLSLPDQLSLATDPGIAAAQEQLDELPHFLAEALIFPYLTGLEFTCAVEQAGDWDAVNAMYDDPPESSAQVLFPERYRADVAPREPSALTAPDGFEPLNSDTFGAAYLLWLFEAPGGDTDRALPDPLDAASAWAGGSYTVWTNGDAGAVGVSLVAGPDGPSLCTSITDWYAATYPQAVTDQVAGGTSFDGDRQDAVVRCDGPDIQLAMAPDLALAGAMIR